jgi:VIT1/CCC1 family predicted Fe2+/Mn2+ transporter
MENIGKIAVSEERINIDIDPVDVTREERFKHDEEHIEIGELLKSMIYGGVDGSTNTLIVILSSFSSGTEASTILALCVAICVGDAIGMGLGDYLSAKAEIDFIKSEEEREEYEVDHLLEDEKKEIIDIYTDKGFSLEDAHRISVLYSTNKQAFVNIMMLEELGLAVVDPILAIKCGIMTFFAFLIFGILPVIPYIVTSGIMKQSTQPWIAAIVIGAVEFFSLGFIKAAIIGSSKLISGL